MKFNVGDKVRFNLGLRNVYDIGIVTKVRKTGQFPYALDLTSENGEIFTCGMPAHENELSLIFCPFSKPI